MSRRLPPSARKQQMHENAARVYQFIDTFVTENHYHPSLADVAAGCYISRSTVVRYLDLLEAWGCITRDPGVARSIAIIGPLPPPIDALLPKSADSDDPNKIIRP